MVELAHSFTIRKLTGCSAVAEAERLEGLLCRHRPSLVLRQKFHPGSMKSGTAKDAKGGGRWESDGAPSSMAVTMP